jgi:hypothetical protein
MLNCYVVSGTSRTKVGAVTGTLTLNGQKARYGIAFVRSICAHAGVGVVETSPDEDVIAVDCDIQFPEANVRVQVKCTSGLTIGGATKSWSLSESWIGHWRNSRVPVYMVIVVVPEDVSEWLDHIDEGTMHRTAAFWGRVDTLQDATSITIPRNQRLTVDTLEIWHNELLAVFSSGDVE